MTWKEVTLINCTETGRDALGNPTCEESAGSIYPARFTPWDAQDIALEGREVTVNRRKLLVQITDLSPRFTLLYVKKYGR